MSFPNNRLRAVIGVVLLGVFVTLSSPMMTLSTQAQNETPDTNAVPEIGAQRIQIADGSVQVQFSGDTYQVSFDEGATFSREFPLKTTLQLRYRTFDPLMPNEAPTSSVPTILTAPNANIYIVQFKTQALEAYQQEITQLGGVLYIPIPDQAYLVLMNTTVRQQVEQLPYVRWVGVYEPAYKLDTTLAQALTTSSATPDLPQFYSIMLVDQDKTMQERVAQRITALAGTVAQRSESSRFEAQLTREQLLEVARMDEILFIDPATDVDDDMDIVREISGANKLEQVTGYTGQGVAGEALDRGFDIAHPDFKKNPLILHSPDHNPSNMRHGSQVAGILFGSGETDPRARGLLPNAARPIIASRHSLGWTSGRPTGAQRMEHTRELVDPKGKYRAVFQTTSWGHTATTDYTTTSAELDEIAFDNDILITQSQSNKGTRNSRPEAWAKNVVSIGGIHGSDTLDRADDHWQKASIGPASDGRIKPDLAHFYGNIWTVAPPEGNEPPPEGINDDAGHVDFGGTSGATPIVAGHFGLLFQMWADGVFNGGPGKKRDVFDNRPHAATAKALMIHAAYQYNFKGKDHNLTRVHQGWGFPDLKNLHGLAKSHKWRLPILIDESEVLAPTKTHSYEVKVNGAGSLKATMVYADPQGSPSATVHRINDLTLKITSPKGTVYWGNHGLLEGNWSVAGGSADTLNTVENVFIQKPEAGTWKIEISGDEIVQDSHRETKELDADYALVVSTPTEEEEPPDPTTLPTQTRTPTTPNTRFTQMYLPIILSFKQSAPMPSPTGTPGKPTPVTPTSTTPTNPPGNDPVFVGAGDIADCSSQGDEGTAKLLDNISGTVFTLGDNAYNDGTASEFKNCYEPTWGRHKTRTKPSVGNHDYKTGGASGYYAYFGAAASPLDTNCKSDCKGYYSYNLGSWHIIVLNSEVSTGSNSEQVQWLRKDLAANSNVCTMAYWHKPLFSSGDHGNNTGMKPLWDVLYEYKADVVLNGHDHHYEVFDPQDPNGKADPNGIREIIVGTGGRRLYGMKEIKPNSKVRDNKTWGVLKMTLHPTSYDWEFVPIEGKTFRDSGNGVCVGKAAQTSQDVVTPTPISGTNEEIGDAPEAVILSTPEASRTKNQNVPMGGR